MREASRQINVMRDAIPHREIPKNHGRPVGSPILFYSFLPFMLSRICARNRSPSSER